MELRSKYAFIVPRFGRTVSGGAETLVGGLARQLAARGDQIEVWTTCAKDNRSWANELPSGLSAEDGVTVRRFPVSVRNLEVWVPHQIAVSQGLSLTIDAQFDWLENSVNSSELYAHISSHAAEFKALFFAPYLFGTTFWGSLINPERSYLIPCLHNEHYAYVDAISGMFKSVAGALFNSKPEQELAQALYGQMAGGEVGMGFEPYSEQYLSSLKPYFKEKFPYLIYLGRKETGKNVQALIDNFLALKKIEPGPLKLIIVGGGSFSDIERPNALSTGEIIDIEQVSEEDKQRLVRHALCLCQPSLNESFSIVLMEAWLLGTPVLVHADCAVTRYHALQSGGGLYFSDQRDFIGAMKELSDNPALRINMARAGADYVCSYYSWPAVLSRFDGVMNSLMN